MSSRIRSEFGTLGARVAATGAPGISSAPRHVWVTLDQQRRPGLLIRWERRADGWWGIVAWAPERDARLEALAARWLDPA